MDTEVCRPIQYLEIQGVGLLEVNLHLLLVEDEGIVALQWRKVLRVKVFALLILLCAYVQCIHLSHSTKSLIFPPF